MTTTYATVAAHPRMLLRSRTAWVGPLVGLAVVVAWCVVLVASGSPAGDVARWVAVVLVAVLAPGWVLVRVSRRAVAPLIEDVAWAAPAGCLVGMLGWFSDRLLPFFAGAYGLGPVVVAVAVLVPWSRRRVLGRPAPGWGARPTLVLGSVQLVALGWMLQTGLLAHRPDPGARGTTYFPDLMYNLDLAGELKHHLAPTYPPVAGATLSYHWFLFAITGHLTTHTGVDTFDAILRLAPASLVPATLLLVAVVARRLAMRVWAGPLAAVLLGAVELSQATRWTIEDGSTGVLPRAWLGNPPQTLGWLAGLAAAGTVIAFVRRAPDDRAVPVALLVPFLVLAAGAKSPELVVIAAGLGLACVVQLIRRSWAEVVRCLLGGAMCIAVFALAAVTIYRGSSYGLRVRWFGTVLNHVPAMFPGYATQVNPYYISGLRYSRVALLAEAALWLLPLLPRICGLFFLVRYRSRDAASWFCLGTMTAGFLLALVLQHPAGSEIYFMQSAYPIGVAGAAAGLILVADRIGLGDFAFCRRTVGLIAACVTAGLVGAVVIAVVQPSKNPVAEWQSTHPGQQIAQAVSAWRLAWTWLRPMTALIAVIAAVGVVVAAVARRVLLGWLCALCVALGAGVFTIAIIFHGTTSPVAGSRAATQSYDATVLRRGALPTMRDAFAAGAYVDAHAGGNDVIATNMYCRYARAARRKLSEPCDARNFVASAVTERRTLVGGWGYADRVVDAAWSQRTVRYNNEPFWDRALFHKQHEAITHPTAAVLDDLYAHHHVRWIFVDRRDARVDAPALDRVAVRRFVGPSTEVWQLKPPAR
jgi:hypothetical protein